MSAIFHTSVSISYLFVIWVRYFASKLFPLLDFLLANCETGGKHEPTNTVVTESNSHEHQVYKIRRQNLFIGVT